MNVSTQRGVVAFLNLHRLAALTDGVFAIVMTLLVLEIGVPEIAESSLHAELPRRLLELWPKLLSYGISFIILGMFWYLHYISFHHIKRSDNGLIWLNIFFLMFIALIPFSTSLFGSYVEEQLPLVIYAINIVLASVMRFIMWTYATRKHRLVDRDISPRLLKWDRLISIVLFLIFMLMIGVSFINVAAARPIFALLGVFGLSMSFMWRRIYQE
jgi:uncharacterized membrane protein